MIFDLPGRLPPAVLLDWQSVYYGPAIMDIGPFISGSLAPEDRRLHEYELLETYQAELVAGGVSGNSIKQLWSEYFRSLPRRLAGVVGWLSSADPNKLDGREKQLVEAALGDGRLTMALLVNDVLGMLDAL